MAKRGGSRVGSGRKKGGGLSAKIKSHVDSFMNELIKDSDIRSFIINDIRQLSCTEGWIYIIKNEGLVKIGVTQQENPKSRLSLYNAHNMHISLIYIDIINDCFTVEKNLHDIYKDKRVKGDWFELTDNNIIKAITFINSNKYNKLY